MRLQYSHEWYCIILVHESIPESQLISSPSKLVRELLEDWRVSPLCIRYLRYLECCEQPCYIDVPESRHRHIHLPLFKDVLDSKSYVGYESSWKMLEVSIPFFVFFGEYRCIWSNMDFLKQW